MNRDKAVELAVSVLVAGITVNSDYPESIKDALAEITADIEAASKAEAVMQYIPAVDPEKVRTVFPSHIVSLIDGRKFKILRRHLLANGLTPDEYRRRYGLPNDYPMVCKNYSESRADLARTNGLGQRRKKAAAK